MKSLRQMLRGGCWIVATVAVCSLPAVTAREAVAQPPSGQSSAGKIMITDWDGDPLADQASSTTGPIIDVTVAPGGQNIFSPANVTIAVGDTVRWTWGSSFHSVTSGEPCSSDSQLALSPPGEKS